MSINLIARIQSGLRAGALPSCPACLAAAAAVLALALCVAGSGCQTDLPPITPTTGDLTNTNSLTLHEGDVIQIKFPGAPELDTVQTIRSDGKITINMAGDVKVSGLTTLQAAKAILDPVGGQIVVKECTVTVQSSAFIIYVTGSVLRPGKIMSDRPLTPFQAVMEAGIDPSRSNLAKVKVIRTDPVTGYNTYKILNLNHILNPPNGTQDEPFSLKPYDTLVVPEKFSLF
jgi:polysaccharide export outer membrane protein